MSTHLIPAQRTNDCAKALPDDLARRATCMSLAADLSPNEADQKLRQWESLFAAIYPGTAFFNRDAELVVAEGVSVRQYPLHADPVFWAAYQGTTKTPDGVDAIELSGPVLRSV